MDPVSDELKRLVDRWTARNSGSTTAVPGLDLHREEVTQPPSRYTREAAVCLIVQGSKRVLVGSQVFTYDANHYLLVTVDLPVVAQVLEASPEKPYLSLTLRLDQRVMADLLVNPDLPALKPTTKARTIQVSPLTRPLVNAFERLVGLLDHPADLPILSPLIQREICYHLLRGPMGPDLRHLVTHGTPAAQVSRTLDWLKKNFARPVKVDELAALSQMSPTAFHHHFRLLTAMSPLQYQKWLRLQEARRLMLAEHLEASQAAYQVGYESPSQFSREYRRLFEAPPTQDIRALRAAPLGPGC